MTGNKETQILAAIRRSEPEKKRVTFFLSVEAKAALAAWCQENSVSESGAIEAMIHETVPSRYFAQRQRIKGAKGK